MASSKASAKFSIKPYAWPIAIASLVLNVGLIGSYLYMLNYNQLPLINAATAARCTNTGYTRIMQQAGALIDRAHVSDAVGNKKFAAASFCFVDYETGKPLDLNSLKPSADSQPILPARP